MTSLTRTPAGPARWHSAHDGLLVEPSEPARVSGMLIRYIPAVNRPADRPDQADATSRRCPGTTASAAPALEILGQLADGDLLRPQQEAAKLGPTLRRPGTVMGRPGTREPKTASIPTPAGGTDCFRAQWRVPREIVYGKCSIQLRARVAELADALDLESRRATNTPREVADFPEGFFFARGPVRPRNALTVPPRGHSFGHSPRREIAGRRGPPRRTRTCYRRPCPRCAHAAAWNAAQSAGRSTSPSGGTRSAPRASSGRSPHDPGGRLELKRRELFCAPAPRRRPRAQSSGSTASEARPASCTSTSAPPASSAATATICPAALRRCWARSCMPSRISAGAEEFRRSRHRAAVPVPRAARSHRPRALDHPHRCARRGGRPRVTRLG